LIVARPSCIKYQMYYYSIRLALQGVVRLC
jgi:hypothetical protein